MPSSTSPASNAAPLIAPSIPSAEIARAGADTVVAGSAVFGSPDWAATITALKAGARAGAADRRVA